MLKGVCLDLEKRSISSILYPTALSRGGEELTAGSSGLQAAVCKFLLIKNLLTVD